MKKRTHNCRDTLIYINQSSSDGRPSSYCSPMLMAKFLNSSVKLHTSRVLLQQAYGEKALETKIFPLMRGLDHLLMYIM